MLTLFCVAPFINRKLKSLRSVPVLMYHSIAPDDTDGRRHAYYGLTTSGEVFLSQMKYLHQHHYEALGIEEVFERLADGGTLNSKKVVAITFDDGFEDFLTAAFPVLQHYGFSATVFLPTGYIGKDRRRFNGRNCLIWDEVRKLHACGIRFGSHTVTHPQLKILKKKDIKGELLRSKETIENILGTQVDDFSYPYAFPSSDRSLKRFLRSTLKECGYRTGVTTSIGTTSSTGDIFLCKRLPINSGDDTRLFKAKLEGCYDWVYSLQLIYKYLMYNISIRIKNLAR